MLSRDPDGVTLALYRPEDDADALELERLAAQGHGYRMSFARPTFRRRAESFERHTIVTARLEGRLVGIGAVAVKTVQVCGEELQAAFYFDHRVHPDCRGRHIGSRLGRTLHSFTQGSTMRYSYIVADNTEALRLAEARGLRDVAGYGYLVLPTFRARPVERAASVVSLDEVHSTLLRATSPFDFYTDPRRGGSTAGHVASFLLRRGAHVAGCSTWSNAEILSEVIESLPRGLQALRRLFALVPRGVPLPHVPAVGEKLRSWYVFDFFATDPALGRELMRQVNNAAVERGIDYCYVIHVASDVWVDALRDGLPRALAPIVRYRMPAYWDRGPFPVLERPYVDVRDV